MTKRKPPGMGFESWVDQQIREATERGEFDNLPGAGKPLTDLDKPYDEVWVMRHLHKEGHSGEDLLPLPLQLRKEVERLPETVRKLRTEREVRDAVADLNLRIVAWLRAPLGPPIPVRPANADQVVERWRAERAERLAKGEAPPPADAGADPTGRAPAKSRRRRFTGRGSTPDDRPAWWRRALRRGRST
ncbi:DnaJ family domain-containing protein [Actinopolymorpha singaporensis]